MSAPITAAISAEIAAARKAQGGTREDVAGAARAAGAPKSFTAAALRNIEDARRCATVEELLWLAEALDVPVRQLLGDHRDRFGHEAYRPPPCGAVEDATRHAVGGLGELTGRQPALAELAYALAAEVDGEGDKRQPAALAKALNDTLAQLWELAPAEEDQGDDLGAA